MIASETWQHLPIKGALYMLVSNENLQEARAAMRSVEDRFNHHYKYPWVLLNNQDFTPTFLKYIRKATTDAPIYFGKIDARAWSYPNWIDIRSAEDHMDIMYAMNVYRGGSLSFRQLLRYQSGLFVHHPLFRDVDYIWRVEPGSEVTCDMVDYDPFAYMKKYNKTLGLTLTMRESHGAVDNLWSDTRQFMEARPKHVLPYNETIMSWITDQGKADYNMCHLWSNFEIVETSFLRSKAYQDYFEFLDRKGGFFYERCTADLLRLLDDPALQEMVTFAEKQLQDSESSAPAFDLKEIKNEEHGTTQDETESMGKTMDELTDQAVAVDSAAFVNEDFMALLQDEMQNENLAELAMAQTSAGDRLQQFADEEEEDMMMA
ncbi:glycolipid 2-alpha-mannosyltransferase-domain-containing protein [Zychaea mexicana]|uniref:glycolipid 2-alpha-mannosyltransferase-domain-containing protein n=1 Tax=Zychaea mexicana TaxID=64656 RepID=UPI0022FF330D|nr:glycolipid 2-alpha-mannosyltransferase-domain-containing protein [Zychaea mexicana]KAI9495273.1 glycolipid 2-alpha-mannosyltransferase-domain-containing protein [Zychaea mexicana]